MALSPSANFTGLQVVKPEVQTSRTYSFDFDTGEIGTPIDGKDAIRQAIRKAIITARFRHPIYNSDYGSELDDLIGQDVPIELLRQEIPRIISDALLVDERINEVSNFSFTREKDILYVSFDVQTVEGLITEGVNL